MAARVDQLLTFADGKAGREMASGTAAGRMQIAHVAKALRGPDERLVHRFPDTDPILAMREDSVFRYGM